MRSRILWSMFGTFSSLLALIVLLIVSPPGLSHPRIIWAFLQLEDLRGAVSLFNVDHGRLPTSLQQVHAAGLLRGIPSDPWGREYVYRANIHDFELYSVGLNGIDERGAGDDVTDHDKRYSCSDYSVGCPYGIVKLLQAVLALFFASSLLYLAASLYLALFRRTRKRATRHVEI